MKTPNLLLEKKKRVNLYSNHISDLHSKILKPEKEIEGRMKIIAVEGNITHKNNIQIIVAYSIMKQGPPTILEFKPTYCFYMSRSISFYLSDGWL